MAERIRVSTGSPWEPVVGYCRAIRVGNIVEVSGTTAMKDGQVVHKHDVYQQTKYILDIIETALHEVGSKLSDVIRTRIYVTDISRWEEVGKAHGEYFGDILPATSMVEVRALIDPDILVEIEAQAIID